MPSYTTSLRLIQPSTGEYSGSWGDEVNNSLTALVDAAVAGTTTVTMTAANVTLTNANGVADQAKSMFLVLGGTPGASYAVIVPSVSKLYFVTNNTGFAQTVRTSGTGISVPNGASMTLRCDGTNVVVAQNYFASMTLGAALPVASGGTGLTSYTSGGVVYASSTSALATGSGLTFDGTNFATTGTASATKLIPTGGAATGNGMYLPAANTLAWSNNGAETMRLDSSGNLLVGTTTSNTSTDNRLIILGTRCIDAKNTGGAGAPVGTLWNNATSGDNLFLSFRTETTDTQRGTIDYNRAGGLVRYNTTSDYRAKDIFGPVANPGATIDALKVYEGRMKGATQSRPMLVAHEAQEHLPYAVSGVKDEVNEDVTPKFQQMDHASLVPLLLAEIQSLRARVAALEKT
jgi:hypothetical protein